MKTFDVQTVEINAPFKRVFEYIADPGRLPEWTHAFKSVSNGRAQLETPNGAVETNLEVHAEYTPGTVDWTITFPDGSVAKAYSRVIEKESERSLYSFIMFVPPAPLEQLEGGLEAQSQILREELRKLGEILSNEQ